MEETNLVKYSEKPLDALKSFMRKDLLKPVRTLEINCGSGTDALFLSRKRFKVTGIDESATLINFAKHKDKSNKCKFLKKEVLPLEFSSRSFNLVLDKSFFMGLDKKEYEHYLKEVYRVLDVNGRLIVSVLSKEIPKFDIKNILSKNYFSDKDINKLFGNYFKIKHTHEKSIDDELILKSYLMEKK